MKVALVILSIVLVSAVALYSWYNRDSDRVLLTLVTAIIVATLGFATKESFSNKLDNVAKEFPVVAFFSAPNYMPLNINLPYAHELSMCLQEVDAKDIPKSSKNVDIEFGNDIYYDALQYLIIKEIFARFSRGWHVDAKQTKVPNGKILSWKAHEDPGEEIVLDDFVKGLSDNYFVSKGIHKNVPLSIGGKMVVA